MINVNWFKISDRVSDCGTMSKPNTLKAHRLSAEFAEKRAQTLRKADPAKP